MLKMAYTRFKSKRHLTRHSGIAHTCTSLTACLSLFNNLNLCKPTTSWVITIAIVYSTIAYFLIKYENYFSICKIFYTHCFLKIYFFPKT